MRANLYIVSAPSGSGKTTLLQRLLPAFSDLRFSISHTTRQPRTGETNGVDYFFVDRPEFLSMVDRGAFLELSLIHISVPTRLLSISYAVFCLKKKKIEG